MDEARNTGMDLENCKFCPTDDCPCYADMIAEIERLKEKCDKQAMVIRRMYVEQYPDTWYVAGELGEKDQNNLPKYIEVVPAWGVDWSQLYERTDRTIGGMGS